jgi:hypothetical protein
MDGTILNLNDAQAPGQRKDNTALRTDFIKVGYRQTGDHKFAVAQYGLTSARTRHTNTHSAQQSADASHKVNTQPSEIKNRLMINIMKEVDRRKHLDVYRHETGVFNDSVHVKNQIGRNLANLTTAQQNTLQTANTIDLGYVSANIKKVRVYDPASHDSVVVDKDIFDKVNEHRNVSFMVKSDPMNGRDNILAEEGKTHMPGDQVEVYVYSRKGPDLPGQLPTKMEHKWHDSKFEPVYKNNHNKPVGLNASHTESEQGVNPHADSVFDSFKKAAGYHQGIREDIDIQENFNPVNDAGNFMPSHRRMAGRSSV